MAHENILTSVLFVLAVCISTVVVGAETPSTNITDKELLTREVGSQKYFYDFGTFLPAEGDGAASFGNKNGHGHYNRCPNSHSQQIRIKDLVPNNCISKHWTVHSVQEGRKSIYVVKDYPRGEGRGAGDYVQPRKYGQTVTTLLLIPVFASDDTCLGLVLEDWKNLGYSVNYILTKNIAFKWMDVFFVAAKPPGAKDLSHSTISVLILVDSNKGISNAQIKLLTLILQLRSPSSTFNTNVKYLTTLSEFQRHRGHECDQCYEQEIGNLEHVRRELCLEKQFDYEDESSEEDLLKKSRL